MKKLLLLLLLAFVTKLICQNKSEYKILSDTIKFYDKNKKRDSVNVFLNQYLFLSMKNKDSLYIGKGYYKKGYYYDKYNKKDSSYYYYKKSILYFSKLNDSLRMSKSLINISFILGSFENYSDSDSTAVEALKYLKSINKYKDRAYNSLAINSKNRFNYKEAIKYYKKAIILSNEKKSLIRYYSNMANSYGYIKDYKKAINIYQNLLDTTDFIKIKNTKSRVIDNLARIKWENKKSEDVLSTFIEVENIRKREKDYKGLISSYKNLSNYYFKLNKLKAFEYAEKMYYCANEVNNVRSKVDALYKLILYPSAKQIFYFEEVKRLNDSIKVSESRKKTQFAKIKYDAEEEKKQKLEARANLAETTLVAEQQKSQKQFWVFIGLTTFLGFIVYFFYKRNKTKKEKIIEVYKTETRLAKKIHDELANDVYLAMNKIQKENREDTSVLCDLEKIYSLTRNISHENSPVVTGEQFEDFLKQLFLEFSIDTCRVMSKGLSEVQVNTLAKEKQIVMYRVLQELLVNMKKHSKANLVVISFSVLKGAIQVRYKDNGIGIDNLSLKNGLQNMETRIKSIGGTIIFESEIQKGFQAKFQLKK
ncbi:tetratricopeptide repeat-containing sensor histidine kinase [Tenacibaculum ovolyticum]|uniref:tetratricopeptide repeat-containing sensor histidine kinase n=1 Tax=Tenacibaculum ovolyticum TaxID=104270 RepID=UPI001F182857|nr:tetratricopeptide repeat-containing sensor histidine kinase [Tenacibaculum ovolyticum]